jgi:hypothetical protein
MQLDIDDSLLTYPSLLYIKKVADALSLKYPQPSFNIYDTVLKDDYPIYKEVLDYIPEVYNTYTLEELVLNANKVYKLKGLKESLDTFGELYNMEFDIQLSVEGLALIEADIKSIVSEPSLLRNALLNLVYDLILSKTSTINISSLIISYNHNYTQELPIDWNRLSSFKGRFISEVGTPSVTKEGYTYSWTLPQNAVGVQVDCPNNIKGVVFPIYIPKPNNTVTIKTSYPLFFRAYTKNHLFSESVRGQ